MVRRFVSRVLAISAMFAIAGTATAQSGSIVGKVTDADGNKPLANARVQAVSGLRSAAAVIAGDDGSYRITGLTAGTYTLVASRIGYAAKRSESISVTGNGTATANFSLTAIAASLNQVVTTSSRGATSEKILDAPASIAVVTSEQLETHPSTSIASALVNVPGLSVSQGGLVQTNIVSRGFNNAFSGQMLMMQDYRFAGVPSLRVNVPFLIPGTNEDIDRIEVLNGPASALYGPNSANGVLHFITKSPFKSQGTTLTLDGGSQSVLRAAARTAGVFGNGMWGYKLSGEYFTGTDWTYNDPNEPAVWAATPGLPAARVGMPVQRDFHVGRYSGEARLDFKPNSDVDNVMSYGYTKDLSGIELTTAFGASQVKNWTTTAIQDRFRFKKFFAQVFYNGNNSGNSDPNDLNGTYYLRTGIPVVDKSTVTVGQIQQAFDIKKANFIIGADYIKTAPRSEGSIFGRNEGNTDITEQGAYLQATMPLTPKVELVTAFRGDQTNRLAGTQFSPHVAFVYRPNETTNLRFTFSRAFNSPASFNYFLDQVANPNQAPGFALRAIGNPSKEGWQFARSCDATINAGLCMHSPFVATGATSSVSSSSANAFPGFIAALPTIVNSLPLAAASKAGLIGLLAQLNPILSQLRPTPANIGSVLRIGTTAVPVSSVVDLQPLQASFNNTWELGYKGIIGNRLRIAIDGWYQLRGDVGTPIGQANPLVFYDPATLQGYLGANLTAAGVPAATVGAALAALVPLMAQLPQGALAFTNTKLAGDQSIIATYQNANGSVDVQGIDFGLDFQADDNWLLSTTYSYMSKNVFPQIGGTINPLMSNSAKNRASGTAHYSDEQSGWTYEGTVRYTDAFPVNSGLFNSLGPSVNVFPTQLYPEVAAATYLDLMAAWRLPIARKVTLALNVTNVFDLKSPTFVGVPGIGRMLITRLKYDF